MKLECPRVCLALIWFDIVSKRAKFCGARCRADVSSSSIPKKREKEIPPTKKKGKREKSGRGENDIETDMSKKGR